MKNSNAAALDSQPQERELPRPLFRPLPPAPPYPIEALPDELRAAVMGIYNTVQAPLAICAHSVLAAVNLAVQGFANVEVLGGARHPISLYLVTVASSGERKTAADEIALRPIRQHEESLALEYTAKRARYEFEAEVYDRSRREDISKTELSACAASPVCLAPDAPLTPILIVAEPTLEGLTENLRSGHPSQGIFSSEAGRFISGYAMNDDNRIKTAAALSEAWDGIPITRCRRGDGTIVLRGRRLCFHLMMQTEVATKLLGDRGLLDQGLLSRTLLAAPDSLAGTRMYRAPAASDIAAIDLFERRTRALLELPLPVKAQRRNELDPPTLTFEPEAHALLVANYNEMEARTGPQGDLAPIKGFASKLTEQIARLAATIALYGDHERRTLSIEDTLRAITLSNFYLAEAQRLLCTGIIDPKLHQAEIVRRWMLYEWKESLISPPDLYQRGPNSIRDEKLAKEIIQILLSHGWLRTFDGSHQILGVNRRNCYEVVR